MAERYVRRVWRIGPCSWGWEAATARQTWRSIFERGAETSRARARAAADHAIKTERARQRAGWAER